MRVRRYILCNCDLFFVISICYDELACLCIVIASLSGKFIAAIYWVKMAASLLRFIDKAVFRLVNLFYWAGDESVYYR